MHFETTNYMKPTWCARTTGLKSYFVFRQVCLFSLVALLASWNSKAARYKHAKYFASIVSIQDMANNGWKRPCSGDTRNSITGTVLWAPLSVLEGAQHSESSMLEGLFISVLSISCNRKLVERQLMRPSQLKTCTQLRRGQMTRPDLDELQRIVPHLKPLIMPLHDLFYPKVFPQGFAAKGRAYNTAFTTQMVQDVCKSVHPVVVT